MVDETSRHTKSKQKSKGRRFYCIDANYRLEGKPGFVLQNETTLKGYLRHLGQQPRYSDFPEQPRFLFDRKLGRAPRDIEEYGKHWLISDSMKAVFEAVDLDALAFTPCDVRLPDGTEGPRYWLCTVVRVLDALDEGNSRLTISQDEGQKYYLLHVGISSLVFRDEAVVGAHIFRMAYCRSIVICDQFMREACEQANLKGILFRDVLHY
ncbi:DUF1629 domain-containing protein [Bradyrhizobium sp. SRS-191]|uniref:DUF1629 domain-containing protein n=1 Tax=Bradyrhizobium sp. SRS-191 TaxID=2962606 RepID=UPI00211E6E2E|nr:DUF1629 domain-containing protein [Bradyrhizobium sp. SRS-191]